MRRRMIPVALAAAAVAWCVAIGCWIWVTPIRYVGVRFEMSSDGAIVQKSVDETRPFSAVSGLGAVPLLIPVAIAALGTWGAWTAARAKLAIAAVLMAVFWFIAGFSIGPAYGPAVLLMIAALVAATVVGVMSRRAAQF